MKRSGNVLLAYYMPFANHPGISIKLHATTLYNSIFWFDDDMLVEAHDEWQVSERRYLSEGSMALLPYHPPTPRR